MRFIETTAQELGEEPDLYTKTKWWLDTQRPIVDPQKYVAVQTEAEKDPNNFVKVEGLQILYNDQAEYYFVCDFCYTVHRSDQFTGSTRGGNGWRERAEKKLKQHQETKGWCEFCDPVFGNGGWMI